MTKKGTFFCGDVLLKDKKYYFLSYRDTCYRCLGNIAIWLQSLSISPGVSVGYETFNMKHKGSPGQYTRFSSGRMALGSQ